jgi:flagellar FliL protein
MAERMDDEAEFEESASVKKKGMSLTVILLLVVSLLLLVTIAVGTTLFLTGAFGKDAEMAADETEVAKETAKPAKTPKGGPAKYFPMETAFTVNLDGEDSGGYLQLTLEVMGRDEAVFEQITAHMPMIRNQLVLLFSSKRVSDLVSRERKETLRKESLTEIQNVLKAETGSPGIEAVFFTSFVMQ